jgi:DNA-binding beta-propeller fold protein YncE
MEDTATYPGQRGSVYVVNWQTNTLVGHVYSGYQPHGLVVDDDAGVVMIANRNVAAGGPAPHHATNCGGKNGYVTFIDMNTQQLVPGRRIEVAVDPYACGYRR